MHQHLRSIARTSTVLGTAGLLVALAACAPSSAPPPAVDEGIQIGIPDSEYSLEALIEAAKKENPITVVDATGKIVEMAENFSAKYGIQATGVKLSASEQEEVLIREADAKNVQSDVFNMSNLPAVTSQFLPEGIGISWMPPDLVDATPEEYQSPAITSLNPWVWAYNTEVYSEGCPIDNMWALTDEDWAGKIAIPDPLLRNETMFWFNQIDTHGDDLMREAYEDYFGEPLDDGVESATEEWVARFAANKPTVTKSDSDVGPIVGAPGQAENAGLHALAYGVTAVVAGMAFVWRQRHAAQPLLPLAIFASARFSMAALTSLISFVNSVRTRSRAVLGIDTAVLMDDILHHFESNDNIREHRS